MRRTSRPPASLERPSGRLLLAQVAEAPAPQGPSPRLVDDLAWDRVHARHAGPQQGREEEAQEAGGQELSAPLRDVELVPPLLDRLEDRLGHQLRRVLPTV